jgi:hypothetical protein
MRRSEAIRLITKHLKKVSTELPESILIMYADVILKDLEQTGMLPPNGAWTPSPFDKYRRPNG